MHHDEGVNGFFLTNLLRQGRYRYDPTNYHGPTLYYLDAPVRRVSALTTFAVRLVTAALRRGAWCGSCSVCGATSGAVGALAAAALVAVSPGVRLLLALLHPRDALRLLHARRGRRRASTLPRDGRGRRISCSPRPPPRCCSRRRRRPSSRSACWCWRRSSRGTWATCAGAASAGGARGAARGRDGGERLREIVERRRVAALADLLLAALALFVVHQRPLLLVVLHELEGRLGTRSRRSRSGRRRA